MVRIKAARAQSRRPRIHQGVSGAKIAFPHILGSDGAGTYWREREPVSATAPISAEFELCHGARTKPVIDLSFELKDLALARQRLEAGKQFGQSGFRIDG
jgi:hypothetical protein